MPRTPNGAAQQLRPRLGREQAPRAPIDADEPEIQARPRGMAAGGMGQKSEAARPKGAALPRRPFSRRRRGKRVHRLFPHPRQRPTSGASFSTPEARVEDAWRASTSPRAESPSATASSAPDQRRKHRPTEDAGDAWLRPHGLLDARHPIDRKFAAKSAPKPRIRGKIGAARPKFVEEADFEGPKAAPGPQTRPPRQF